MLTSRRARIAAAALSAALGLSACGSAGEAAPQAAAAAVPVAQTAQTLDTTRAAQAPPSAGAPAAAPAQAKQKVATTPVAPAAAPVPNAAPEPAEEAPSTGVTIISADAAAAYEKHAKARTARAMVAWEEPTLAALRKISPRLVDEREQTVARIKATCAQVSGMFIGDAIDLVRKRFSNAKLKLTQDMAEDVYGVILQTACYEMPA